MDEKRCNQCGEIKPLTEFHRYGKAKDGRQKRCKECSKRYSAARRVGVGNKVQAQRFEPVMEGVKQCNRCEEVKPVTEFYAQASCRDGRRYECKPCTAVRNAETAARSTHEWAKPEHRARYHRAYNLRRYGITVEDYDAMLAAQGGVCAVCRKPETAIGRGGQVKNYHVDHDHETGEVRGLLCGRCNTTLGRMEEDVDLLFAMAKYVKAGGHPSRRKIRKVPA